jgi:hypothetical protein
VRSTDEEGIPPATRSSAGSASASPRHYYRVSVLGVARYESLSQRDAETHARHVYGTEGVICDIEEIPL